MSAFNLKDLKANSKGFYELSFPNKFEVYFKRQVLFGKADYAVSLWLRAYHEQSKKVIDVPNFLSNRLVHDDNPMHGITESELAFIIDQIKGFKELTGEWTEGRVKPPRQSTTRNLFDSILTDDYIQSIQRHSRSFLQSIPRDDSWAGGTFQIPVQGPSETPERLYVNWDTPPHSPRTASEDIAMREALQRQMRAAEEAERAARRARDRARRREEDDSWFWD